MRHLLLAHGATVQGWRYNQGARDVSSLDWPSSPRVTEYVPVMAVRCERVASHRPEKCLKLRFVAHAASIGSPLASCKDAGAREMRERERDREEHVANRSERDGYARGDTLRRGHFGHGLRFHVHLCGSSVHSSIGVACCGGKPCDHPTVAHAPLSLEIPGLDIDLWGIDATHLFTVTCAESGEQSLLLPQASLSGWDPQCTNWILTLSSKIHHEGPEKATRGGWMGANQNFSPKLGLCPKINPTSLSSNSVKTAQL
jgi:hypothetical protein